MGLELHPFCDHTDQSQSPQVVRVPQYQSCLLNAVTNQISVICACVSPAAGAIDHSGRIVKCDSPVSSNSCEWRELGAILPSVSFTSEQIAALMHNACRVWRCRIRLKFTAGSGCTVLEIFDRDVPEPSVPIRRLLVVDRPSSGLPHCVLDSALFVSWR